jgi:hypothetical protein
MVQLKEFLNDFICGISDILEELKDFWNSITGNDDDDDDWGVPVNMRFA